MGKSWAIEEFGRQNFNSLVTANFEQKFELKYCFNSLNPKDILKRLEFYLEQPIIPGTTLLFLDEIQLCPRALTALRYFKEQMPELHVIAAGSLLEFTLNEENFSFPVGRVDFLFMRPLSFIEFLQALNKQNTCSLIHTISLANPIDEATHQQLLQKVRNYFWIGGMPEVVSLFTQNNSFEKSRKILLRQIEAFNEDFSKYSGKTNHLHLKQLFDKIPELVGRHFKFSKIDPHSPNPARDYKRALSQLKQAGLTNQIFDTRANGIPLKSEINMKKFKAIFLDIGLMQQVLQVDVDPTKTLLDFHQGALAEQFVGQELLAYSDPHQNQQLYFWETSKQGSSIEIDYVTTMNSRILPIEVKAGTTGRLRSLQCFLECKNISLGLRISEHPLSLKNNVLSVPMYMISELPRLLEEAEIWNTPLH